MKQRFKIAFLISAIIFFPFFACQKKNNNLSDLALLQNKSLIFDLNNNILEPKSLYGKKTIINYWATWCGPCIKEMPEIENAQKKLSQIYNFVLVSDENMDKILDFTTSRKFDLNFFKSKKSNEIVGVFSLPTSFVYDEKGKKIKTIIGVTKWDSEEIINQLKSL